MNLAKKVTNLGSVSDGDIAAKLTEIKTVIDAVAQKVSAAVNVETEKVHEAETIKGILDSLLGVETAKVSTIKLMAAANTADSGLTDAQREKLRTMFSEKMAALIEQYYNEAVQAIENATTVEEAKAASANFKRNVDMAKMIDSIETQESESLLGVYIMLAVAIVLCAILAVTMCMYIKRRSSSDRD